MLDIAAAKFSHDEAVQFVPADAQALPFSDREFDLLVCQFGVMFFQDKPGAFREAARVTQPGGTYLFSTWGTITENPFARIAHEATAAFFPDNPPGFHLVPFSYADPDTVKADLENTGWRDVEYVDTPLRKTIPYLAEFARGLGV